MTTHVVILGGGFAGVSTARELEKIAPSGVQITLVNRENYQLFTPMLPEAASGSVDARHIAVPLRVSLCRAGFLLGEAERIDVHAKTLDVIHPVLKTRTRLSFDHLVLALGAQTSTFGLPGIAEHTLPLKSLVDAAQLREHIGGMFEAAAATQDRSERDRFMRFLIVGGGFTGVETAGELAGFVRRLHKFYPALREFTPELIIIDSEERLLTQLPKRFGKRAAASLRRRGVDIQLGEKVASADEGGLRLEGGRSYESATIVWTAGVEPAPLVAKTGLKTSRHGALVVNGDLSVPGVPGVWAAGDCARVPKGDGGTYASLAQNAVREGPLLARNIVAALRGQATKTFTYTREGMMASLGDRDAIAELPGQRMIAGLPAWLLWRGYYLSHLPGLPQKLRVAADWTLTGMFASNIARLPWISQHALTEEDHAAQG